MEYKEVVGDFAERTRKNLKVIEDIQKINERKEEVYEVTQLINSMLGLLVFPQQEYCDRIPETPLEQLANEGWPNIGRVAGFPPRPNLKELFKYLRNAIAHFNMQFLVDEGKISGVKLWNESSSGHQNWETKLMLEDLREITDRFIVKLKEEAGLGDHRLKTDTDHCSIDTPGGAATTLTKNQPGTDNDLQGGTDP